MPNTVLDSNKPRDVRDESWLVASWWVCSTFRSRDDFFLLPFSATDSIVHAHVTNTRRQIDRCVHWGVQTNTAAIDQNSSPKPWCVCNQKHVFQTSIQIETATAPRIGFVRSLWIKYNLLLSTAFKAININHSTIIISRVFWWDWTSSGCCQYNEFALLDCFTMA